MERKPSEFTRTSLREYLQVIFKHNSRTGSAPVSPELNQMKESKKLYGLFNSENEIKWQN
jgi:hypothetical protein